MELDKADLDKAIHDAVQKLDEGLELVIIRGKDAKWRARRGIYFQVEAQKAKGLLKELKEYYHVRTGVNPPRRILTPEPIPSENHPSHRPRSPIVDGWAPLVKVADATHLSESGIRDAVQRREIKAEVRKGDARDGRTVQLIQVRADANLARFLAGHGVEGALVTPDGRVLSVKAHRPKVHLTQPEYTKEELASVLDCTIYSVKKKLRGRDVPTSTRENGLHVHETSPALVQAIEDGWNVDVSTPT